MTKSDLTTAVAERLKLARFHAEQVVDQVFKSMAASMKAGEGIELRGFGSFSIRHYRGYGGRNPRTGEPVEVLPKRLPFFKVGKELKERADAGRVRGAVAGEVAQG